MFLRFDKWHKGHLKDVVVVGGELHVICQDCGVIASAEGIGAKVSAQHSFMSVQEWDALDDKDKEEKIRGKHISD